MELKNEMIHVDESRCTSCGFCADECPAGIIVMTSAGGRRGVEVRNVEHCTRCGHCVAICPKDAIEHAEFAVEGFREMPDNIIDPRVMRDFLLSRRSVRAYKEKQVPEEIIEQLIEVGTHAGTASNAQTEGFIVIRDRTVLSDLEGAVMDILWKRMKPLGNALGRRLARIRYGEETARQSILYYERFKERRDTGKLEGAVFRSAPALIAVQGKRSNLLVHENCAIATRNMEMAAASLGLGTCWAGFLLIAAGLTNRIGRSLGVPDDRNIYSAIMLGYPRHEYRKLIPRTEREVRWM